MNNQIEISSKEQEDFKKVLAARVYMARLKQIKKSLSKECSFLSNYIDSKGARFVRAVVNGKESFFTMPHDLSKINDADYDHLRELIQSKM